MATLKGNVPGSELVRMAVEYVMVWPFMCHVGLVLFIAWIAASLRCNISMVFLLGFIYLYQIEKRQRERNHRRIRHQERKNSNKIRLSEGETVRWMNQTLESIWPVFLENFASQMILLPISPWFLNKYKPWTAKKVLLQHLCLGEHPPLFTMIRPLAQPTDGDHVALEAAVEFVAGEDMNAVLAIQMHRRLGFGLWTSFHLSNLHLEGRVKIGVKFAKGWPVIERIRICFANAPFVRVTARPLFDYGVDVTELPGVANWLDKLIADALEKSLVEPNMLVVDVEKLMSKLMFPNPVSQQQPNTPSNADWFEIHETPPLAKVTVEILEASQLRAADMNGLSDPFVKGSLGGKSFKTKIIWKTLDPKWNETFQLPIASWELPNLLFLRVRDKDRFHDDELGHCMVQVNNFRDGRRHEEWLPLQTVKTGRLHLAITVDETKPNSSKTDDGCQIYADTHGIQPTSQELPASSLPSAGKSSPNPYMERQKSHSLLAQNSQSLLSKTSTSTRVEDQINQPLVDKSSSPTPVEIQKEQTIPDDSSIPGAMPGQERDAVAGVTDPAPKDGELSDEESSDAVDVGIGSPGSICILHPRKVGPCSWPSQKWGGAKKIEELVRTELSDNSVLRWTQGEACLDGEEDSGIDKPKSGVQKLWDNRPGVLHWNKPAVGKNTGVEKLDDCSLDQSSDENSSKELVTVGPNGTEVHLKLEKMVEPGDAADRLAATGFHPHHDPTVLDAQNWDHDTMGSEGIHECSDAITPDSHLDSVSESPNAGQTMKSKAKGFLKQAGKAAHAMGHTLSSRLKPRKLADHREDGIESDELTQSSGELDEGGQLAGTRPIISTENPTECGIKSSEQGPPESGAHDTSPILSGLGGAPPGRHPPDPPVHPSGDISTR